VLRAQRRQGFDRVMGFGASQGRRCRGLGEDDGAAGPGMVWVDGVACSGTAPGAQRRGLREDNVVVGSGTTSRAWGRRLRGQRRHRLGSGKMAACKGDRPWSVTTVRRLWVGLDNGAEVPGRS
jgi:hypothetical protein